MISFFFNSSSMTLNYYGDWGEGGETTLGQFLKNAGNCLKHSETCNFLFNSFSTYTLFTGSRPWWDNVLKVKQWEKCVRTMCCTAAIT